MQIELLRGNLSDMPFIMATERLPGYDAVVGRWDEAHHCDALGDPAHAYFIGFADGEPLGFAILRGWASPEQVTLLKRIAVTRLGAGVGRLMLAKLVDAVFEQTDAWRFWLGVFPENTRAQRAYRAVGFLPEGVARGSAFFGGVHRDELTMAIIRPDWERRRILAIAQREHW
jgi:RimJ/RimL family protein N-acetyltransferase